MNRVPEKKAIIIVEDNEPIAEVIRDTLNGEAEYRAVVVNEGKKALEVLHSIQASAAILDVGLPDLDGFELYDALRADPATRHIPVIFVTANCDVQKFAQRGITNVIPKPFHLDELLARVAMVCGIGPDPVRDGYDPAPLPEAKPDQKLVLDARQHDLDAITYFLTVAD